MSHQTVWHSLQRRVVALMHSSSLAPFCAAFTHRTWSSSLHLSTEQLQQPASSKERTSSKLGSLGLAVTITIFPANLKCSLQECSSCDASTCELRAELGYVLIDESFTFNVLPQSKMIHTAGKIIICLMTNGLRFAITAKCFLRQRGYKSMSLHTRRTRKEDGGK